MADDSEKAVRSAAHPEEACEVSKALAVRPSQLRASATEAALTIVDAFRGRDSYCDVTMPVAIAAGADDRLVDPDAQSARLHRDILHGTFDQVPGTGHIAHQTAKMVVMEAINWPAP